MENGFEHDLAGSLARDTTPVAKWMATWRSYVTWPLGSHSQGARQHLSTLCCSCVELIARVLREISSKVVLYNYSIDDGVPR